MSLVSGKRGQGARSLLGLLALCAGLILVPVCAEADSLFVGSVQGGSVCKLVRVDASGNISFLPDLAVGSDPSAISCARDGTRILVANAASPTVSAFRISEIGLIESPASFDYSEAATDVEIMPDSRFAVINRIAGLQVLEFLETGETVDVGLSSVVFPMRSMCSTPDNLLLGSQDWHLRVLQIDETGALSQLGTDPIVYGRGTNGAWASPNGRHCIVLSTDLIETFHISETLAVTHTGQTFSESGGANPLGVVFTPDSRYAIIYWNNAGQSLKTYRINEDSTLAEIGWQTTVSSVETAAATPDGRFLLVAHSASVSGETLSVLEINHDGTLTKLAKDQVVNYEFVALQSIPPQVLAEYDVRIGGRPPGARPADDFSGWTTGGAPGAYDLPAFDYLASGTLVLQTTSNTSNFGFWQSPQDGCPVIVDSLYRARFEIATLESSVAAESRRADSDGRVCTLRLRANAQTFQQADDLVINDIGAGSFAPTTAARYYDVFFLSPWSSCSRPEDLDDEFLSFDLLNFDPEAAIGTRFVLNSCVVDRVPECELTVAQVVKDYTFDATAEGWTAFGAPGIYRMPYATYIPGSLVLQSLSNTNTFGFWTSPTTDIAADAAPALFRAVFTIHTDVVNPTWVPRFRFRTGLSNNALIATKAIDSVGDSEMSPFFDAANPGRLFNYSLYFFKPETEQTENLFLAFDILSYSLTYMNPALFAIDNVKLEELVLPRFPLD